jgi:hypothetical protein
MTEIAVEFDTLYALGAVGYELWSSQLIGNSPPITQRRFERMDKPEPGDLVLETSSAWMWIKKRQKVGDWWCAENAIGTFLRQEWEPIPNWNEEDEGESAPKERVWYIRSHDGRELRWTNANFIAILPSSGWDFLHA